MAFNGLQFKLCLPVPVIFSSFCLNFLCFKWLTYYFTEKIILDTVFKIILEERWRSYQNWSTIWHVAFFLHDTQFCSLVWALTINITWCHPILTTCLIMCSKLYLFSYFVSIYAVQPKCNSILFKSSEHQILTIYLLLIKYFISINKLCDPRWAFAKVPYFCHFKCHLTEAAIIGNSLASLIGWLISSKQLLFSSRQPSLLYC